MDQLQRVLSDAEALEWLRQERQTNLSQIELAKLWGWYEMKVSRRLKSWEDEGRILRRNGVIVYRVVTPITLDNQRDNTIDNTVLTPTFARTHTGIHLSVSSVLLSGCAISMFGVGVTINAWFARSLGSTELAQWLFLAVGVVSDCAAFVLPRQAGWLWRTDRKMASLVAWGLWSVTFGFALIASVGFASLNIADVTSARASRSSPGIELAQHKLEVATAQAATECKKVGPLCRARQEEERQALAELGGARKAVQAGADPQVTKAAQLVAWLTPWKPSAEDVALGRLALLTLLPQLGGLMWLVARK
jgi:hypothetical protein